MSRSKGDGGNDGETGGMERPKGNIRQGEKWTESRKTKMEKGKETGKDECLFYS